MGFKAFHVSADPNPDVRDQEELDWNIRVFDEHRLDLQLVSKDVCKLSNKTLKKTGKHKIKLKDFFCTFKYKDFHTHKNKRRKQLPTSEYTREQLETLCRNKRFQWNPGVTHISGKAQNYYYAQQCPILVIDIDDVECEDVAEKLKKDWKLGLPYSLSPSASGKGTHLHIWIDLSQTPIPPRPTGNPREIITEYKTSYRHMALIALKVWVGKSITKDTGLVFDEQAARKEEIAVTPEEIGIINQFWRTRSPVLIPLATIQTAVNKYETSIERRSKRYLDSFVKEFDRFLEDEDVVDEILQYLQLTGVQPGKRSYYEQVIKAMKTNRDDIVVHWSRNLPKLWWLRTKQENVSIGRETGARELFGFVSAKNLTYVRQVGQYIWSLAKSEDYVYKKKTNLFMFIDLKKKYFTGDFLIEHWYAKPRVLEELSVDNLSELMGNGKTWKTICEVSPHARYFFGHDQGLSLMLSSLEMSCAENKRQRREQICKFFNLMKKQNQRVKTYKEKTG